MNKIPLFKLNQEHQDLKPHILDQWEKILDKGNFTYGPETKEFEEQFANYCGVQLSLAVNSGTTSLIIALKSLGIKPGDEVITTPVTFAATVDAIVLSGAQPVLVDIDPRTGNIDPKKIIQAITNKTKAVLVVHLYGIPCEMNQIVKICRQHQLYLVEDCSHAHGSTYHGKKVGSFGDFGCFSLYPSKTLGATGNAGVLTTNSNELYEQARSFAHHGLRNGQSKYQHYLSGYNALINNLQSAVLLLKLANLDNKIKKTLDIAKSYNRVFHQYKLPGMYLPKQTHPSLYVYAVQLEDRSRFMRFMKKNKIETGIYYPTPIHLQPSMSFLGLVKGDLPAAEKFSNQTVAIPCYPNLLIKEQMTITNSIVQYITD